MRYICFLLLLMSVRVAAQSGAVSYTAADSARVVQLLDEGRRKTSAECLTLFFARKFVDRPYVSHTLELKGEERLAVNLSSLDCTTLVENVCALALTVQHGGKTFADFCAWLQRLRYDGGKIQGYSSRNHYFSQWIQSGQRQGLMREVTADADASFAALTQPMPVSLTYMSAHPASYPLLKVDAGERLKIADMEKKASGYTVRYIPVAHVGKGKTELGDVRDGDILALTTRKQGLDVSHVGFAVWGRDGRLHLLNASSIHHKVVIEPMTLSEYMSKHPSQTGIRVIRLK